MDVQDGFAQNGQHTSEEQAPGVGTVCANSVAPMSNPWVLLSRLLHIMSSGRPDVEDVGNLLALWRFLCMLNRTDVFC